jgi:hypothetical protein
LNIKPEQSTIYTDMCVDLREAKFAKGGRERSHRWTATYRRSLATAYR